MAISKSILEKLIALQPIEKAELVDSLISSLDKSDSTMDRLWANEAESRLTAYKTGELKTVSISEVLSKYK